jgi:hypothetical protein
MVPRMSPRISRSPRILALPVVALLALAAILLATALSSPAFAAEARFPDPLAPTQISRDMTLEQAARHGLVQLTSKGRAAGDGVQITVDHKPTRGPVTVTVRVEFAPRSDSQDLAKLRADMPRLQNEVTKQLNRYPYKTRSGDPVRFAVDFQVRARGEAPRPGYHQVELVEDPKVRSGLDAVGTPNKGGAVVTGTWIQKDVAHVWPHEVLHLAGLDDRYVDVYEVNGKRYPLPDTGMDEDPARLREWARNHKPPLPTNGKVRALDKPGTGRCDIMGSGAFRSCRRISQRDIDFLASQAGVQVTAEPGDILVNKNPEAQNLGVGFRTIVFAPPGGQTTAEGISIYCIDAHKALPSPLDKFDVLGPASEIPGMERLAALLALSGRIQSSLMEAPSAMTFAVWLVTDGEPLADTPYPDEAAALLAQAGVPAEAAPGLPHFTTVNAGSPDTAAVTPTGVEPPLPTGPELRGPLPIRLTAAGLYPNRLRAGRNRRAELVLSVEGSGTTVAVTVERRVGRRWRAAGAAGMRTIGTPGQEIVPVRMRRLRPGRHRLVVRAVVSGKRVVVPFTVTR